MTIFNSYVSHNQRVCWVFSSIRVPGKTSSSAWDPGLATLPPGRLPCYPDIPHQRAKRSTYWNFPIRGFRRKLVQKEENSKEASKIWRVVSYGLQGTGCHFAICIYIYIDINPVTGATSPIKFAQKPADIFPPAKIPCVSCACCFAGGAH